MNFNNAYKLDETKPFGDNTAEQTLQELNEFVKEINEALIHQYGMEIKSIDVRKVEHKGWLGNLYYPSTTVKR